ncbi:hypothetical protein CHS0354_020047 [Potamilus streckersoni]|uniref:Uncharacterized protein n=1 Tax=Potamilus streckersoni TaxID=2493646 RepID=A0AAE0VXF3_9BIVA|nr:hypothetical protein CHS0354_020047 [Potamilus streckersoni]
MLAALYLENGWGDLSAVCCGRSVSARAMQPCRERDSNSSFAVSGAKKHGKGAKRRVRRIVYLGGQVTKNRISRERLGIFPRGLRRRVGLGRRRQRGVDRENRSRGGRANPNPSPNPNPSRNPNRRETEKSRERLGIFPRGLRRRVGLEETKATRGRSGKSVQGRPS